MSQALTMVYKHLMMPWVNESLLMLYRSAPSRVHVNNFWVARSVHQL